jgi:hypothetical protein
MKFTIKSKKHCLRGGYAFEIRAEEDKYACYIYAQVWCGEVIMRINRSEYNESISRYYSAVSNHHVSINITTLVVYRGNRAYELPDDAFRDQCVYIPITMKPLDIKKRHTDFLNNWQYIYKKLNIPSNTGIPDSAILMHEGKFDFSWCKPKTQQFALRAIYELTWSELFNNEIKSIVKNYEGL